MPFRESCWETGPVVGTKYRLVLLHLLRVWGWRGDGHARLWWPKWPGGSQENHSRLDACSCLVIVRVFECHDQKVYCVLFNVYLEILFTTLRWRVCFAYGFSIHWESMFLSRVSFVMPLRIQWNVQYYGIPNLEKIQWVREENLPMRMQYDVGLPTLPASDATFLDLIPIFYYGLSFRNGSGT